MRNDQRQRRPGAKGHPQLIGHAKHTVAMSAKCQKQTFAYSITSLADCYNPGVGVMVSIPGTLGYIVAGWDRMGLPPTLAWTR
jgi:hypothetical protein